MGGFNPISTIFDTASNVVSATSGIRSAYGDYRDTARQNRYARDMFLLNEQDTADKAALDQKQIDLNAAEDSRQRQQALKRASATRKAAFGQQGINTSDGSGQAVLLGLFQESDEEQKYRDRLDAIRKESIAQDKENKRRRNLLSLQNTYRAGRDNFITSVDKYF